MHVLLARLMVLAEEKAAAEASQARRSQVRTVDRSERIRTYNYPENRIADHRVNFKAYNLDQVLDGDLDAVLNALAVADRSERLQAAAE
jgi:peptide chain release factor 1